MKRLLLVACLLITGSLHSQTAQKIELVDFAPDLAKVTEDLKVKFEAAPTARTNFEENLKAINALIVQYQKTGKREQLARLYLLDAHIYADGMNNTGRAKAIWSKIVQDFPSTQAAKGAAISLTQARAIEAAEDDKTPEGLEIGQRFPSFTEKDINGATLSVAAYRGKVTLIDFWATWCGPCMREMPNVLSTYKQYHASGFEIIGVSLDTQRASVLNLMSSSGMTWAQYFDGQGWKNKLAEKYGVESIPMAYLLDKHGVIVGKALRGSDLAAAVAKALSKD